MQRPRVVKRVSTSVPEHMGMCLERQFGDLASSLDHSGEARRRKWRAALGRKHEGRLGLLFTVKAPQGAQFVAKDRMGAGPAVLGPTDVESGRSEVDLCSTRWSSARRLGDPIYQQSKQLDLLLMSAKPVTDGRARRIVSGRRSTRWNRRRSSRGFGYPSCAVRHTRHYQNGSTYSMRLGRRK